MGDCISSGVVKFGTVVSGASASSGAALSIPSVISPPNWTTALARLSLNCLSLAFTSGLSVPSSKRVVFSWSTWSTANFSNAD